MPAKPETKLVKQIQKALDESFPGFFFKSHGGMYQRAGLPDIIGCYNGRFIGIEVKCPGRENTLTTIQQNTIEIINHNGGIAFMSSSVEHTIKTLKRRLKK